MPCYYPLQAFKSVLPKFSTGKADIRFKRPKDVRDKYEDIQLPCGQCVGCRLERSRQWAVRCMHEASSSTRGNCFITLTFRVESLCKRQFPESLNVRDFQLFMKRLRKKFGQGIRFFHCGEYGELTQRPHYHACLFNFDFPDRKLWKNSGGVKLYTSKILEELWPYGFSTIGDVTFESAAYVARYIMKKVNGKDAFDHYLVRFDEGSGELLTRKPEYVTMSRNGGIGRKWYESYGERVRRRDCVVVRGNECKPPRFYDSLTELSFPDQMKEIKDNRVRKALLNVEDNTPQRLRDKEKCVNARVNLFLKRGVE